MRLLLNYDSEYGFQQGLGLLAQQKLDVRRRQQTAESCVTARCPRCGHALVARMGRVPLFWCACTPRPGGGAAALRPQAA